MRIVEITIFHLDLQCLSSIVHSTYGYCIAEDLNHLSIKHDHCAMRCLDQLRRSYLASGQL